MAGKKRQRDWNKVQPHHVDTGEITTRKFAEAHPEKVEWVTAKKPKKKK